MLAQSIQRIEVTSRCNLACVYCLHPILTRPKQDIADRDWDGALDWIRWFVRRGTQGEVQLSMTGEPFLHPRLGELALELRAVLGPHRRLLTTTNGTICDSTVIAQLAKAQCVVYVSAHVVARAAHTAHALHDAGILKEVTIDPVIAGNSWAGQVDWPDWIPIHGTRSPCPFLQCGHLCVASTGDLYTCCLVNGDVPPLGHVREAPHDIRIEPIPLCERCWCRLPEPQEYGTPSRVTR